MIYIYGTFVRNITILNESIDVDNKNIAVFQTGDPAELPWKDMDIDVVLECTGSFTTQAGAEKHIQSGAKKVLLSTTGAADIPAR